jgi:hypothetical protein
MDVNCNERIHLKRKKKGKLGIMRRKEGKKKKETRSKNIHEWGIVLKLKLRYPAPHPKPSSPHPTASSKSSQT